MARGAASVLNFNCAVILIPVCRNLVNAMRGCFESVRSVRRLFDKNILFHKWCAYVICLFAAIHIGAHMFNVNRLATTSNPKADIMVDDNDTAETIAFTSVGLPICAFRARCVLIHMHALLRTSRFQELQVSSSLCR